MTAILLWMAPDEKITVVLEEGACAGKILRNLSLFAQVQILEQETAEYKRLDGKTTFFVCRDHVCLPPDNCIKNLINISNV